jgi:hypothetical protein
MLPPRTVKVASAVHPSKCWAQWPDISLKGQLEAFQQGIDPMEHCTFAKGHAGPHQWEKREETVRKP